jgi:hypothetical protein
MPMMPFERALCRMHVGGCASLLDCVPLQGPADGTATRRDASCAGAFSSPNFLHFVGLDRGRHPGLPWGVAGVTRRST